MSATFNPMRSKVGRRIALLFVGCALGPLIAFQLVATESIRTTSEQQTERQLHGLARTSGMMIAARLDSMRSELHLAAAVTELQTRTSDPLAADEVYPILAEHARSMQLVGAGAPRVLFGDATPIRLVLDRNDEQHLAAGAALVRLHGPADAIVMAAAVAPPRLDRLLVAAVDPNWFWTAVDLAGPGCEFAAIDRSGSVLFHTSTDPPSPDQLPVAAAVNSASGTFEWSLDGKPHVARYWHLFIEPQYRSNILVIQSLPKAGAFATSDSFVNWAWLFASATLLVAALASLVQIRRTLLPVFVLRHASERLGDGDLSSRAAVSTKDEFGELAGTFNEMANRLQTSFERQQRTERELVRSRDDALAAARAKEAFLTNVSHELRTPMAKIVSATEILTMLNPEEHEARQEFTQIARTGADDLSGMLDNVLELATARAPAIGSVETPRLIRALREELDDDLGSRLQIEIEEGLPPVVGDPAVLLTAIRHVIDNAAKFGSDQASIELRASRQHETVHIDVSDRGPGIEPADLERIFEPFVQVGRDQMTDKADGAGVGLALARRAAESCGGTLTASSTVGTGSTFRFTLRIVAVDQPGQAAAQRIGSPMTIATRRFAALFEPSGSNGP